MNAALLWPLFIASMLGWFLFWGLLPRAIAKFLDRMDSPTWRPNLRDALKLMAYLWSILFFGIPVGSGVFFTGIWISQKYPESGLEFLWALGVSSALLAVVIFKPPYSNGDRAST